jgi:predicted enzyme related to lactoylglutathione lyase
MSESRKQKPGDFCWVELMTSDRGGAKAFYQGVMGWDFQDDPVPGGGTYTMLHLDEGAVGGLFELNDEMKAMGIPPHWESYVLVENADEIASKATSLGGKVLKEPFDIMEIGRMAVIQDPTGAVFSVWQAKAHKGTSLPKNTPGMFGWNELITTDHDAAVEFYSSLFGWTPQAQAIPGMQYSVLMNGQTGAGGIMKAPPQMQGVPSHWMVYFAVDDCDAGLAKVKDLGGRVLSEPIEIPNVGRFAPVQDPQGATCSLIKFSF